MVNPKAMLQNKSLIPPNSQLANLNNYNSYNINMLLNIMLLNYKNIKLMLVITNTENEYNNQIFHTFTKIKMRQTCN